jgi:hypothetical protein
VPPEQSFRSDDWKDFAQLVDASEFRFSCEPDALTIGKARFPPELFPKDFDLLQQVINQELLVSVNLARQKEQAELQNVHRYSSAALSRPCGSIFGPYAEETLDRRLWRLIDRLKDLQEKKHRSVAELAQSTQRAT